MTLPLDIEVDPDSARESESAVESAENDSAGIEAAGTEATAEIVEPVEAPSPAPVDFGKPDAFLAGAVDIARAAAIDMGGDAVGEHQGVQADGDRLVVHLFAASQPGYRGWHWAVSLGRAPRVKRATVNDVVLLPGPSALRAPEWIPWSQRLQPGDLGAGDLLPTAPDDPRLVPGYVASGDPQVDAVSWEIGLGRERVMSELGRIETAERWFEGIGGPTTSVARLAPAPCGTCGFYLPLAGAMQAAFGACANEYAPDDGRVVTADHGCGAHSSVEGALSEVPIAASLLDAE